MKLEKRVKELEVRLEDSIKYSEHLASKLGTAIEYSEYLSETISNFISYHEFINEQKIFISYSQYKEMESLSDEEKVQLIREKKIDGII